MCANGPLKNLPIFKRLSQWSRSYANSTETMKTSRPLTSRPRSNLFASGCVLVVALTVCLGVNEAPHPKKQTVVLKSPRAMGETVNAQMVIASASGLDVIPDELFWEYDLPIPRDDVMFIVQRALSPHGPWVKFGEVRQPPFKVIPSGFYRIETKNL